MGGSMRKLMLGTFLAIGIMGNVAIATTTNTPGIKNSAHNFAGGFTDEICIYCHTPHNSNTTVTDAPLWNHTLSTGTYIPYTRATMSAVVGQPTGTSKLCLSCHDGTVSIDSYGGSAAPAHLMTGSKVIGLDLKNDHPISFVYDAALATADGKLNNPVTSTVVPGINSVVGTISAKLLDGTSQVQCTSCHDAHNAQGLNKILKVNNTGSALCLTCHKI